MEFMVLLKSKQEILPKPSCFTQDYIEGLAEKYASTTNNPGGSVADIFVALGATTDLKIIHDSSEILLIDNREIRLAAPIFTDPVEYEFYLAKLLGNFILHTPKEAFQTGTVFAIRMIDIVSQNQLTRIGQEAEWFATAFLAPVKEIEKFIRSNSKNISRGLLIEQGSSHFKIPETTLMERISHIEKNNGT